MMNDVDIKNKRILLFDFDGTLIETASGNTFATDLTDMRIKMDVVNKALDLMQENGVKVIDKGDNNITFTSLYYEGKENGDSLS